MDTRNCVYLVYLAGNPGNDGGWEHWENDSEESKPKRGVGAQYCRGPLRDYGTLLRLLQKRIRKWGYSLPNSHLSLFESCSQPGHQLPSTVGCPVRNKHAPVARESPWVQIHSCLMYKAKDTSVNCAEVTSKVVRQDMVGHIVCYTDDLHDYHYLHGTTCQLCDDFLYTTSFHLSTNLEGKNIVS